MDRRQLRKCKSTSAKAGAQPLNSINVCKKVEVRLNPSFYHKYKCPPMKRRRPSSEEDDSHWLLGQNPLARVKQVPVVRAKTPEAIEDSKADIRAKIASATPDKNTNPADLSQVTPSPVNSSSTKRLDSGIGSEIGSGSENMDLDRCPSPIASGSSMNNQGSKVTEVHNDRIHSVSGHDDMEAEHLQAMAGIELLRSRVKELKRTKLELERRKMELCEVREEARKDMEEVERRAHLNMSASVQKEREAIKKQAEKDVEAIRKESKAYQETLRKQAEIDRTSFEKLYNSQLQTLRKHAEKELESEHAKAKKNERAAVKAAEEKILRKMDSMQRKMQGKIDAAEKERKKMVEDTQREAKREVESYQRTAEQAVIRYNKLIAEYNVLEGRITGAARLLSPTNPRALKEGGKS
ncbi:uncharacterized protein LOC590424 isoform X3 [Strongylocentrotus purpuratus]|nr:uncharacterized protein LOC590424 isoform X3 [Strongylocentrotus purpuratus]|eukprot:XP_011677231.1 PREDICTED: centrosomal protein of 83 kDa isoform X3 [Strongylocentrotus purpuratus]